MNQQAKLYVDAAKLPQEVVNQLSLLEDGQTQTFANHQWGCDQQGIFAVEPVDKLQGQTHPLGADFPISQVCIDSAGGRLCAATIDQALTQLREHQGYGTPLSQMEAESRK